MTSEEFAELEAATWDDEEARVDTVRIRGFAMGMRGEVEKTRLAVEKSKAAMLRAVAKLERDLATFNATCTFAERVALFAARAMSGDVDPDTRREAAAALEEIFG